MPTAGAFPVGIPVQLLIEPIIDEKLYILLDFREKAQGHHGLTKGFGLLASREASKAARRGQIVVLQPPFFLFDFCKSSERMALRSEQKR